MERFGDGARDGLHGTATLAIIRGRKGAQRVTDPHMGDMLFYTCQMPRFLSKAREIQAKTPVLSRCSNNQFG
jgi:hypothetical protein